MERDGIERTVALPGRGSLLTSLPVVALLLCITRPADGADPIVPGLSNAPAPPTASIVPAASNAPAPPTTTTFVADPIVPAMSSTPAPSKVTTFAADPIGDGALLGVGLSFGILSEAILSTGEIVPQQPQDPSKLLAIDRYYVRHTPDPWATPVSNVGFAVAFAWAVADPALTWARQGKEAALVDAVLYAEVLSLTWSATNLAKIAFRRPRPSAYLQQAQLVEQYGKENAPDITDTNSALSFFSGHAAITASMTATATYLAFARSPGSARPWLTLGVGALTTFATSYARVQGGHHFPTDVFAGALAGAAIGVLVPHLHRTPALRERHVWLGFAPEREGGLFTVGGLL